MSNRSAIDPIDIAMGGCVVALSVGLAGASYWYARLILEQGFGLLDEPLGVAVVVIAIMLAGAWAAIGWAIFGVIADE